MMMNYLGSGTMILKVCFGKTDYGHVTKQVMKGSKYVRKKPPFRKAFY
jgi:hypothetical protein